MCFSYILLYNLETQMCGSLLKAESDISSACPLATECGHMTQIWPYHCPAWVFEVCRNDATLEELRHSSWQEWYEESIRGCGMDSIISVEVFKVHQHWHKMFSGGHLFELWPKLVHCFPAHPISCFYCRTGSSSFQMILWGAIQPPFFSS